MEHRTVMVVLTTVSPTCLSGMAVYAAWDYREVSFDFFGDFTNQKSRICFGLAIIVNLK